MMKNSADFYQTLRSPNGRFHHLNIVDTILPDTKLIATNVKINDNSHIPLCNSAESLWDKGSKHAAIIGEGGMGKTVSLIRVWESYVRDTKAHMPIPIFIALNEYNNASDEDKKKYIIKYISKYYLKTQYIVER
jgi:predicted NACHT family NTPase